MTAKIDLSRVHSTSSAPSLALRRSSEDRLSSEDGGVVVPGLAWRSPRVSSRLAKTSSRLFSSPRASKSGRTSSRSTRSHDTGRRDVRPLHQIAELLGAQDEAKLALRQAAREAARELRECVKEFITTETNYSDDLRHVVDVFVEPLRALLPAQLHYTVFSNFQQLQIMHAGLQADILKGQEKLAIDSGLACVEAFSKLLPYFKM